MAKGNRAPTAHHRTARANRPMELIHIDTAGPFPVSLRGSRYVVMFVDSASRLQRPYGTRGKSAAAVLAVVKRFIADMGVPRAFRSDNGAEYTNHSFVECCNTLGIRRELTAPYTPQQNGPVESALWRAFKARYAARLGVSKIYPDIRVNEVKGFTDAAATSLWMDSLLWASECFNRSATAANDGWLSPHDIFYGNRPPLPLLRFFSRPTTECPDNIRVIPVPACAIFLTSATTTGTTATKCWTRRRAKLYFGTTLRGTIQRRR